MTDDAEHGVSDTLSVHEMQEWLQQEVRNSAKAHELRVKGATEFVNAYSEGKLTPELAMDELLKHDIRWGEALFGTGAYPGKSDEAILKSIDEARSERFGKHAAAVRGGTNKTITGLD